MDTSLVRFLTVTLFLITAAVPLVYWNSTMYPFITAKVVLFQSLVELAAALWLTLAVFYRHYRPRLTSVGAALLLLMAALLLSAWLGADWRRSFWSVQPRLTGIFLLLHLTAFFFIVASLGRQRQWTTFGRWLWWPVLLVAALGVISGFLGRYFGFNRLQALDYGRVGTLFGNPTFLAGYLLMNIFAGFLVMIKEERRWLKMAAFLLLVTATLGLFLTQTLGNIAAFFAGTVLLAGYGLWYVSRQQSASPFLRAAVRIAAVAGTAIILIILATRQHQFWQNVPGLQRLREVGWQHQSLKNRLVAWQAGREAFKLRPWFGWGWENFLVGFNHFYNPVLLTSIADETFWDKSHNIFLEYLYTAGVTGLLAFLFLVGAVFWEGWRLRSSPAIMVLLIGFVTYLIQGLVVFDTPGVYLMLFLYLAFIDGEYQLLIKK